MCRYGLLLAVCLLWTVLPAQAQDTSPDTAKIKTLVDQLASPSYMQREKARVELEKIGPAALPALIEAAKSTDQEVSKSAGTLVQKLQELDNTSKLLAPKMVHLKIEEMPVSEAIKELNRISGYNLQLQGDQTVLGRKRISLDTGKPVPFWQAFDLLCEKAGLTTVPTQPGSTTPPTKYSAFDIGPAGVIQPAIQPPPPPPPVKIKGAKGKGAAVPAAVPAAAPAAAAVGGRQIAQPGFGGSGPAGAKQPYSTPGAPIFLQEGNAKSVPTCYCGAVRIQALSTTWSNGELQVTLRVTAEPGVESFSLIGSALVDKAVDEHGQVLDMVMKTSPVNYGPYGYDTNMYYQHPNNLPKQTQLQLHLKQGIKQSTQLKELRGKVHAAMLLPTEPLVTVKDVTKAVGKRFEGKGGGAITLQSLKKIDDKRYTVEVHIDNPPGMNNVGPNFQVVGGGQVIIQGGNVIINGNNINNNNPSFGSLVLADAQGKSFRYYTMTKNQTVFANGKISRQMTVIYEADAGQGEPDQLLLVGRRTATVAIPFQFENVSLK